MERLSGFCFLNGFAGILSCAVLGSSRILWVALAAHVVIAVGLYLWISRSKGGFSLVQQDSRGLGVLFYAGLLFLLAGLWSAVWAPVGDGEKSMTREDLVYFGAVFAFFGLGMIASSLFSAKKR